ncbi:hypothetical protein DPX16_2138 [Anabarilius grahami]|uniref:Uncharacterized protein n=1 Tax=Anabarilius grahami TaxID=495550 RepID=A0A3N0XLM9_ANAGA|nr:hypothetical protein DPX16_2138 [Anabarilius grahami]
MKNITCDRSREISGVYTGGPRWWQEPTIFLKEGINGIKKSATTVVDFVTNGAFSGVIDFFVNIGHRWSSKPSKPTNELEVLEKLLDFQSRGQRRIVASVVIQRNLQLSGMTLGQFLTVAAASPGTIERVWFSLGILDNCLRKDDDGICLYHDTARHLDPDYWAMRNYNEVTLLRKNFNVFDVFIEWKYRSDRRGIITIDCCVDRIPIDMSFTRSVRRAREGVLHPAYQDQNPDSPNPSKVCSADRPVCRPTELRIDMNALIQQGIQRQQAKLFRKMEKKATETKSCYPGTTLYQPYSQGDN